MSNSLQINLHYSLRIRITQNIDIDCTSHPVPFSWTSANRLLVGVYIVTCWSGHASSTRGTVVVSFNPSVSPNRRVQLCMWRQCLYHYEMTGLCTVYVYEEIVRLCYPVCRCWLTCLKLRQAALYNTTRLFFYCDSLCHYVSQICR